jgi:sulfatase modifying factor 1
MDGSAKARIAHRSDLMQALLRNIHLSMRNLFFAALAAVALVEVGRCTVYRAYDDASDGIYAGFWGWGSNGGYGFQPWEIESYGLSDPGFPIYGEFGGYFIASSFFRGLGNIDTDGKSFGLSGANISNDLGIVVATRRLQYPLMVGEEFSVDMGVAYRDGIKGIAFLDSLGNQIWYLSFERRSVTANFQLIYSDFYSTGPLPPPDYANYGSPIWEYAQDAVYTVHAKQEAGGVSISVERGGVVGYQTYIASPQLAAFKFYTDARDDPFWNYDPSGLNQFFFNRMRVSYTAPVPVADLSIQAPSGNEVANDAPADAFAPTPVGSTSLPRVYTIRNLGSSALTVSGLSLEGLDAEDFSSSSLSSPTIQPGASATFEVTFAPQTVGLKTCRLLLRSNDPDENPFVLNLGGSTSPLVSIETVAVADAGNAGMQTPPGTFGGVPYEYLIGRYEVTIAQYVTFLNSVAAITDADHLTGLWNSNMATDLNVAGISRSGAGTVRQPFVYTPINGSSNRPIAYVSWLDAARFANWLHNGATNGASTETGAYTLNGATNGAIPPNPEAVWYLPTINEWFKAAFYKGGGTNAGYWLHPTQSDDQPGNVIGSANNQANYRTWSGYSVTQSATFSTNQNYLTDVGAFSGSPGAYGTFDQGGNLREWVFFQDGWGWDNASSQTSGAAGADWNWYAGFIGYVTNSMPVEPANEDQTLGFRVAAVHPSRLGPSIVVEHPAGTPIASDMPAEFFGNILVGAVSTNRIYTIRNSGIRPLELFHIIKSGLHTNEFLLTPPGTNVLAAGESTTFAVQMAPTFGGSNYAKISIVSNDTNNSTFAVNLSGFGLGQDLDSDGDGLNDAAEFSMSPLGFDWQTAQEVLVGAFFQNVGKAGVYTAEQYEANRLAGIAEGKAAVTNNPAAYNLYTRDSIMDLRLNGAMVQKQGGTATVVFQPQTTMDLVTQPFADSGPAITNEIPMPGDKGFLRIQAKPE